MGKQMKQDMSIVHTWDGTDVAVILSKENVVVRTL